MALALRRGIGLHSLHPISVSREEKMADRTYSRRQFLRLSAGAAMGLTLATALPPGAAQAAETPPPFLPQVSDIQDDPEVWTWITTGFGPLFVAGHFLDTFGRNLAFENLPAPLTLKYLYAGAEWKTWPQARALYETIPAQVRAGGPDALWEISQGTGTGPTSCPAPWAGPRRRKTGYGGPPERTDLWDPIR